MMSPPRRDDATALLLTFGGIRYTSLHDALVRLLHDAWYRSGDDYRQWAIATFAKNKALIERLGLAAK